METKRLTQPDSSPIEENTAEKHSPPFIEWLQIFILLLLPALSLWLNFVYILLAIVLVLVSKYVRKEKWSTYGVQSVHLLPFVMACVLGIGFGVMDHMLLEPLVNRMTGHAPDLSSFQNVRGNVVNFAILLAVGWVIGGLFEEVYNRGVLLYRITAALSDQRVARLAASILVSISFALAHSYQGVGGVINVFYVSLFYCLVFYWMGQNVWYAVLAHGFYDTVGVTYLFLGR